MEVLEKGTKAHLLVMAIYSISLINSVLQRLFRPSKPKAIDNSDSDIVVVLIHFLARNTLTSLVRQKVATALVACPTMRMSGA